MTRSAAGGSPEPDVSARPRRPRDPRSAVPAPGRLLREASRAQPRASAGVRKGRVAPRLIDWPPLRRASRRRHPASGRGARLGDLEPGHRQRSELAVPPLRQRPHDPDDPLRDRRLPQRTLGRSAGGRGRYQLPQRREDGRARLPSERARRGRLLPATRPAPERSSTTGQIDRSLAQDLLDRFVASGVQTVFVGYSTGLHGPSGIVVPYPNHENHMHLRFPAPAG